MLCHVHVDLQNTWNELGWYANICKHATLLPRLHLMDAMLPPRLHAIGIGLVCLHNLKLIESQVRCKYHTLQMDIPKCADTMPSVKTAEV